MEVTLATGVNHDPPYVYGNNEISHEHPGVTIDILNLIERKLKLKFVIQKTPWKRVIFEVKNNRINGGFHFSFKEKRRSFIAFPIPEGAQRPDPKYSISNRSYMIYKRAKTQLDWDGKKITVAGKSNFVLTAIRGSSIVDEIKKKRYKLLEVDRDQQMLQVLEQQRVDALVGLENMIDAKIESLPMAKKQIFEKVLPPIMTKAYYIGFSKKFYKEHPETVWAIWKLIDQIKQNGELKKIYMKYSKKL